MSLAALIEELEELRRDICAGTAVVECARCQKTLTCDSDFVCTGHRLFCSSECADGTCPFHGPLEPDGSCTGCMRDITTGRSTVTSW